MVNDMSHNEIHKKLTRSRSNGRNMSAFSVREKFSTCDLKVESIPCLAHDQNVESLVVPPAIAQFSNTLDRNLATQTFKLLNKYRPETKGNRAAEHDLPIVS